MSKNDAMNRALRQAAGRPPEAPPEAVPDAADANPADQGARSGPPPAPENPLKQAVRAWRNREGDVTP